jgi:hypothetical protein
MSEAYFMADSFPTTHTQMRDYDIWQKSDDFGAGCCQFTVPNSQTALQSTHGIHHWSHKYILSTLLMATLAENAWLFVHEK